MTENVRSVARSLHLLAALNRSNGAGLNWLAKTTGLSRGTTYRMLETFVAEGYAIKDPANRGYWLNEKVRGLSDGYAATGWVMTIAKARLEALGRAVVWPLSLCIPSGTDMVVKMTTDLDTPLTMELISAGLRMPMASSAAGRAYLAYCPLKEREVLIDVIRRSAEISGAPANHPISQMDALCNEIRAAGCAAVEGTHRISNIAVPVMAGDSVLACLVLRFYSSAMTLADAVTAYLSPLRETATDISRQYTIEHTGEQVF